MNIHSFEGGVTVVEGDQRGDEGKGRFVDMLAAEHDVVARFNGGPNAGHTVILEDGTELNLHGIPSGVANPNAVNVIGNGALIDPLKLPGEVEKLTDYGIDLTPDNFKISSAAHLILPHHIHADEIREAGLGAQGSTKSGIAQVAAGKSLREGLRAEIINNDLSGLYDAVVAGLTAQEGARDIAGLEAIDPHEIAREYVENARGLGDYITDTVLFLNNSLRAGKRILAEGAQAFWLDLDHGMYPFTSSSSPTSGGAAVGLGLPPQAIDHVVGVSKVVQSHVGGGPFVTEIKDERLLGQLHGDLHARDAETGTTTGRTRKLGYYDIPSVRRSHLVNGTDEMAITKLDWVPRFGDDLKVCVAYERKGRRISVAPDAAYKLEQSEPIYEALPNWDEDIQGVREFRHLPMAARGLVEFIEEQAGVRVSMIGVGPQRDQVIVR